MVFGSTRDGPMNVYSKAADGTGESEQLTTSDLNQWPSSWTPDGQTLLVDIPGSWDLQTVSFGANSRTEVLLQTEFIEIQPTVSPDGRWLAYASNEAGQFQVHVRPFPNVDDGKWPISRVGGLSPVWAPNGKDLYFRRFGSGEMMRVSYDTEPTFSSGNPEVLFAAPYLQSSPDRPRQYDLSPDGDRFLMVKEVDPGGETTESHIVYVQHWFEELKERVPVN